MEMPDLTRSTPALAALGVFAIAYAFFARVRLRESVRDGLRNKDAENHVIFSVTETA